MSHKRPAPPQTELARQARRLHTARAVRKAVVDVLVGIGYADRGDDVALVVPRAGEATVPQRMAAEQSDDPTTQARLRDTYRGCLDTYRRVVRAQDFERDLDDVGAAVAFFVAVNLRALHGVDATEAMLEALQQQLRGVARQRSNWDDASIEERQAFFERVAILSVLVAGSQAQLPTNDAAAASRLRRNAREYLSQMLGLNPDLLTLGDDGLTARQADARRAA